MLRMMVVPIFVPSLIYGDNMSVVHNAQRQRPNLIAYHAVRVLVAMGELLTGHLGKSSNLADLVTKVLYAKKCWDMVLKLLINIYDDNKDK